MAEFATGRGRAVGASWWSIAAAAAAMLLGPAAPGRGDEPVRAGRVFLTFDVELEEDIEALRQLDPPAPCTLFLTGQFAEAHPDVVREWAKRHEIACHTMSHPHMVELDAEKQQEEIRRSAAILERLAGAKCLGFRAPYLESDERTRRALIRLGFRYQSSTWESDDEARSTGDLLEFPIADRAGDYNLFEEDKVGDAEALELLLSIHADRSRSGRPMVVLLHPHDIARHADVLRQFIARVGRDPANWGCFRDWLDGAGRRPVERWALWVDTRAFPFRPVDIIASAKLIGITDLIVQAYDPAKGALFGPGNPRDDVFNGIIDEAQAGGLRVHAWFPLCFDPARLRDHPEWGVVNARGERSSDFVCPTSAAWRKAVQDRLEQLIESYDVDGILFDELRFPDAESCQCPACRASLGRRARKEWPLGRLLDAPPEARRVWLDHRTDAIRALTETLAVAMRRIDPRLLISAALRPEGALDARGVESSGQSYEELAPLLDFAVATAYHRREGQPSSWVKAVQLSGQWRAGSTPVWIGVQAFAEPGRPTGSLDEFGNLLESVRYGSAGAAFCSYATLFSLATGAELGSNMPAGAADLVRRWSQAPRPEPSRKAADAPAPVASAADDRPPRAHPPADPVEGPAAPRGPAAPGFAAGLLAGSAIAATIVLAMLVVWSRGRRRPTTLPELPLSTLEGLAGLPLLGGDQAFFITDRLRRLRAADLDRIRADAFLLLIHADGRGLPADVPDQDAADAIRLQCAVRGGLVHEFNGRWRPTAAGADRLRAILLQEADRTWDQFVEDRLEESLQVSCPHCGATQMGHWLRPTLGCASCHRRFPLRESRLVVPLRRRAPRGDRGAI